MTVSPLEYPNHSLTKLEVALDYAILTCARLTALVLLQFLLTLLSACFHFIGFIFSTCEKSISGY